MKQANAMLACSQLVSGDMLGLSNGDWQQRLEETRIFDEATIAVARSPASPLGKWI